MDLSEIIGEAGVFLTGRKEPVSEGGLIDFALFVLLDVASLECLSYVDSNLW
jgi:hypothetical protein